jgi:hypothetical protein
MRMQARVSAASPKQKLLMLLSNQSHLDALLRPLSIDEVSGGGHVLCCMRHNAGCQPYRQTRHCCCCGPRLDASDFLNSREKLGFGLIESSEASRGGDSAWQSSWYGP